MSLNGFRSKFEDEHQVNISSRKGEITCKNFVLNIRFLFFSGDKNNQSNNESCGNLHWKRQHSKDTP